MIFANTQTKFDHKSLTQGDVKQRVIDVLKAKKPSINTPVSVVEIQFYGWRNMVDSTLKPQIETVLNDLHYIKRTEQGYYIDSDYLVV